VKLSQRNPVDCWFFGRSTQLCLKVLRYKFFDQLESGTKKWPQVRRYHTKSYLYCSLEFINQNFPENKNLVLRKIRIRKLRIWSWKVDGSIFRNKPQHNWAITKTISVLLSQSLLGLNGQGTKNRYYKKSVKKFLHPMFCTFLVLSGSVCFIFLYVNWWWMLLVQKIYVRAVQVVKKCGKLSCIFGFVEVQCHILLKYKIQIIQLMFIGCTRSSKFALWSEFVMT
jgi:hypothetical protein